MEVKKSSALIVVPEEVNMNGKPCIVVAGRKIGSGFKPFVIAEIGINHEGSVDKAIQMVDDAKKAGCECVKFQCHIVEDEMIPNNVIPANAPDSIWDIMARCALSEEQEMKLKKYTENLGLIYLCTPFSRAAANRLEKLGVPAYKIGSGECNNYPLVEHIAKFGKPIILSTGMNDLESVRPAVEILRMRKVPYALMHCTSMYPTPYDKVRLGVLGELARTFPDAAIGLSDHSIGNYTCLAGAALGASILEKHFTSDKTWPGPDMAISIDGPELADLVRGSEAVWKALGGTKTVLPEEKPTIDFAYASVVTIEPVQAGQKFSMNNIWVKRPGTGALHARQFGKILGRKAKRDLEVNVQLSPSDIEGYRN